MITTLLEKLINIIPTLVSSIHEFRGYIDVNKFYGVKVSEIFNSSLENKGFSYINQNNFESQFFHKNKEQLLFVCKLKCFDEIFLQELRQRSKIWWTAHMDKPLFIPSTSFCLYTVTEFGETDMICLRMFYNFIPNYLIRVRNIFSQKRLQLQPSTRTIHLIKPWFNKKLHKQLRCIQYRRNQEAREARAGQTPISTLYFILFQIYFVLQL